MINVHLTWKTETVPEKWIDGFTAWKDLPQHQFTVRLWTDQDIMNLVQEHYSEYLDTYNNLQYNIQRVDMGRTFILHKYGGIYSDLDISPIQSPVLLYNHFHNSEYEVAFTQ